MKKLFYRLSNIETNHGLWYNTEGEFTGLIHSDLNFCTNSELEMPFDASIIGYLSAAESLEELYRWFTKQDIEGLQKLGYFIHEYEVTDWKWYEKFSHWVINQQSSILTKRIILLWQN